ncbi:transcription factor grauzone-like [Stomoxys calcitrans]|uniref:C2H2-type domain-containing protein n=1 Tax=Stomoxys calcitrans TaxID=35570 RepID=A0A1I8PX88_STOCA|nr:transcription factor grauzone-like [Stomoxys calcitrans]
MSIDKACCCLCYTPSYDFKLIQNETGECNEVYDVTVKYFDPMLLSEDQTGALTTQSLAKVLCSECWRHIAEFHEFQLNVIKTRDLMCGTINKVVPEMVVLPAENKNFYSEDEFSDKEPIGYDSDNDDDDVPLTELFKSKKLQRSMTIESKNKRIRGAGVSTSKNKNPEDDFDIAKNASIAENNELDWEKVKTPSETECETRVNIKEETSKEVEGDCTGTMGFEADSSTQNNANQDSINVSNVADEGNKGSIKLSRRGRKPKSKIMPVTKTTSDAKPKKATKPKVGKIRKQVKDPNKKSYMDKCRENDLFIAQWKPNLDCDLCPDTATNFNALREHFRAVHKTRCYIKCCDRKFYRRCVLMDHISLHINPEIHKCDICGKSSTTKHNLKLHKQVMHGTLNQFECDVCHRLFNQKPTLDRHLLTHVKGENQFFCKECGKGYVLEVQLNSHIKTVHGVDCVCDQCGRTFHGANALKKHLMDHAGIPKRKYPCDICGAQLNTNNNLRRHKAAYHHDGSTAYICSVCGKVSSSENALKAHKKRVHEENKKHKCTYCDKAFKRPKDLREHIATHTGIDLYQCPHCPQTFKVSANMHHHRKRVHPIEWEEARKHRLELPKVNIMEVTNQIVL